VIGDLIQPTHLIFILLIALIFLGPKRLPEAGKALGKGIRDFRGALSGMDITGDSEHEPAPQVHQTPVAPEPVPVAATVQAAPAPANDAGDLVALTGAGSGPVMAKSVSSARDTAAASAAKAARADVEIADPSEFAD
jgi:sec-independent protein translocase protein TatA